MKAIIVQQPRYSKEKFARRGNEIYESQVRVQVADFSSALAEAAKVAAYSCQFFGTREWMSAKRE